MWKAIQLDVECPDTAAPPQKLTPTLCQYAWRQTGIHGNVLKLECMMKTVHKMNVRGISQWLLPGEEHPLTFPPTVGQKEVYSPLWRGGGIIPLHCFSILLPPALLCWGCQEQQSIQAGVAMSVHYLTAWDNKLGRNLSMVNSYQPAELGSLRTLPHIRK